MNVSVVRIILVVYSLQLNKGPLIPPMCPDSVQPGSEFRILDHFLRFIPIFFSFYLISCYPHILLTYDISNQDFKVLFSQILQVFRRHTSYLFIPCSNLRHSDQSSDDVSGPFTVLSLFGGEPVSLEIVPSVVVLHSRRSSPRSIWDGWIQTDGNLNFDEVNLCERI